MSNQDYATFLHSKIKVSEQHGFDVQPAEVNVLCKPHQSDIIIWALKLGKALIGCSFGLGKTFIQCEIARILIKHKGGKFLIVCPLGVKHQFSNEDGPTLGLTIPYVKTTDEFVNAESDICITNYERVRDGGIDVAWMIKENILTGVSLDEGSVLRSLGSDTTQEFILKFREIPFKFVCTATPCPNEYLELINYSEFLSVMDRGQALTRFFQRDSQKAGNLTLHPHHEDDFWIWVSSWAIFLNNPSDLGYNNDGYTLPEMEVVYHLVELDTKKMGVMKDRDGQVKMLADAAGSLQEAAKIKRASIDERLMKCCEIIGKQPFKNYLLWHILEDERKAIEAKIPTAVTVYGSQELELREERILDFSHGRISILATKPEIAGSGCNFQYYCSDAIFMSIDYRFQDFIQAVHRIYRFQQTKAVTIHIIYTAEEQPVIDSLIKKWELHNRLIARMGLIIKKYGLNHAAQIEQLKRRMNCDRIFKSGGSYEAINNDSVIEMPNVKSNSIGLLHTSIPFGNHYEYSSSYNDFGHNENNEMFWKQMDYLVPEFLRALKPGRNAVIHVKDRIRYGNMTGFGMYTLDPFSDECVAAFRKHGFHFIGRITVVTDVVRENNQTYRLGWTEKTKDASKMGCGLPEYLLIFRKPQTDKSRANADEPVVKDKGDYSRGRWQTDASSFWKSNGNRVLSPEDIAGWNVNKIYKWFKEWTKNVAYDYDFHVLLSEMLEGKNKLPSTFMALAPSSVSEGVWTDVNYMQGLNVEQRRRKAENHICPLPFDIVKRVIECWSMKGDTVLDPFAGLFTVPYMAVKMDRKAIGIELSSEYFKWGCKYMEEVEYGKDVPTLFDLNQ